MRATHKEASKIDSYPGRERERERERERDVEEERDRQRDGRCKKTPLSLKCLRPEFVCGTSKLKKVDHKVKDRQTNRQTCISPSFLQSEKMKRRKNEEEKYWTAQFFYFLLR